MKYGRHRSHSSPHTGTCFARDLPFTLVACKTLRCIWICHPALPFWPPQGTPSLLWGKTANKRESKPQILALIYMFHLIRGDMERPAGCSELLGEQESQGGSAAHRRNVGVRGLRWRPQHKPTAGDPAPTGQIQNLVVCLCQNPAGRRSVGPHVNPVFLFSKRHLEGKVYYRKSIIFPDWHFYDLVILLTVWQMRIYTISFLFSSQYSNKVNSNIQGRRKVVLQFVWKKYAIINK